MTIAVVHKDSPEGRAAIVAAARESVVEARNCWFCTSWTTSTSEARSTSETPRTIGPLFAARSSQRSTPVDSRRRSGICAPPSTTAIRLPRSSTWSTTRVSIS